MSTSICAYCMLHRYETFAECISNIRENANLQNIPFYSFSFRDSYNEKIRKNIENNIDNLKIEFIKKQIPSFIKKKDLFYNKTHLEYVRSSFPRSRVNFLHMNNFVSDPSSIPYINNFEIAVQFDDDSWFKGKIDFNYDLFAANKEKFIATSHTHTDNTQKRRETKIGLFEDTYNYCRKKKIIPKYKLLAEAIEKKDIELFHQLPWTSCNFNIFKMSIFNTPEWGDWIDYIKSKGGIYINRWGDQEIIGTFAYIYYEDPIIDLDIFPHLYVDKIENQSIIYFKENLIIRVFSKIKKIIKKNLFKNLPNQ
mgnify:CR=1 FL=1